MNNKWFSNILVCPVCHHSLVFESGIVNCTSCGFENSSEVDLRPKQAGKIHLKLNRDLAFNPEQSLRSIETSRPEITYTGPTALRDSRAFMSEISKYLTQFGKILDLGCGNRDQQAPIEYLGHQYVGVDYSSKQAHFLADAHCLPFKSESFDCVFSYAVLEHLHNPVIAINEIERILKPKGIYVGTASLGEPFHQSFFHHTSWGFLSLVATTNNLVPIRLWAAIDTLNSLSRIGRYPRIIKLLISYVHKINKLFPFLSPRKMKWPIKEKEIDALHRAGSIAFVVSKNIK